MARRSMAVSALAREAGIDLDEALVTLWDADIDVDGPSTVLRDRMLAAARDALSLDNVRAQMRVDYWTRRTGLSRDAFTKSAQTIGVVIPPNARRIPKNSLRKLHRHFTTNIAGEFTDGSDQISSTITADETPFEFLTVGRLKDSIDYLHETEIIAIHKALEEDFRRAEDPIFPPGVRDEGLVSMSAHKPQTSHGDTIKYPTIEMAAAALFHSIVLNHGFHNGNKRTALVSLIAFLRKNGLVLTCSEDELFRFTLRVAQHRIISISHRLMLLQPDQADREVFEIATWILTNSKARPSTKGERPTEWRKLKRLLAHYGCTWNTDSGTGNRLNITRVVERKRTIGSGTKKDTLSVQAAWAGDGTEAHRNTIRRIRSKLELTPEHNVDSEAFYDRVEPNDLIEEYLHILRRLSVL